MKILYTSIVSLLIMLLNPGICAGENSIRIADTNLAASINPLKTSSTISANLLDLIYDPLVLYSSEQKIGPALARKWRISPDGINWYFTLHSGIKFHDGSVLTAYDVKATYDSILASKHSFYSFGLMNIKSVDVISDYDLVIKLKRYDSFLPFFLRHVFIVPQSTAMKHGDNVPIIGTGAFQLASFSPKHIELNVFKDYFGGSSSLDRIVVDIYPNQRTCLSKLIAGDADMLLLSDYADYDVFSDVNDIYRCAYPVEFQYWIVFNLKRPVLANKRVRRALNYALGNYNLSCKIDKCDINDGVPEKDGFLFGCSYPQDPKKALAMLHEEGWKDRNNDYFLDKNGVTFELKLIISDNDSTSKKLLQLIQRDFERIGVKILPEVLSSPEELLTKSYVEKDFDIMLMPSNVRSGMQFGYLLLHSSQINKGGNCGSYNNREVDSLLDEIRYNQDPTRRKEAEGKLTRAVCEDPPGIPMFVKKISALANKRYTGFSSDPFNFFRSLRNVKVKGSE